MYKVYCRMKVSLGVGSKDTLVALGRDQTVHQSLAWPLWIAPPPFNQDIFQQILLPSLCKEIVPRKALPPGEVGKRDLTWVIHFIIVRGRK